VTDVPEHLLRRSKAAREKAAGGTGDAGASEAPAAAAQASASEPGTEVATTAAATPAVVEEPAAPVPPYVEAALRRPRVPKFAIPVLATLPVWALLYAGSLTKPAGPADPELAMGQQVYAANCASCHGSSGEGGTGRPLGDVMKAFPNKADQILWVHLGSPEPGTPYGDPSLNRKAGQGGYTTKMPGFKGVLTDAQIAAVVRYEREQFGGSDPEPSTEEDLNATGKTTVASGHPEAGGAQSGTSQQSGDSGSQANGVTEPGNAGTGSDTNQANASGGKTTAGGSTSGSDAGPTSGGSSSTQTGGK
jgi:mono/diheme cytochrome c family protein